MRIIIEEPLRKHMEENHLKDIAVEVGKCIACGGEYKNVNARFVEENEVLDPKLFDVVESEFGKIYLTNQHIEYGETLRLIWKSYYFEGLGVSGPKAIQD